MPKLTPGELTVMRIFWQYGELKPSELQGRYPKPVKNPAIRSHLTILLGKGHLARRKRGNAYYLW